MFDRLPSSGDNNAKFIRLKNDSDSVKGVFAGKPLVFRQHWVSSAAGKKSVVCTGDICSLCQAGDKSKFRFRANLIIEENKMYVAKIAEFGRTVYDSLSEIGAEYDLSKTLVKLTRKGQGMDTSYSALAGPPSSQPTPDQLAAMSKVTLLDLDPAKDGVATENTDFAPVDAASSF